MIWARAVAVFLLIVVVETINGTIREIFIAPALGDPPSRQIGVLVGSALTVLVSWWTASWIGARSARLQLGIGSLWVVLLLVFEVGLGWMLGYTPERILSDFDVAEGGLLGFGLVVMLFSPVLGARLRGLDLRTAESGRPGRAGAVSRRSAQDRDPDSSGARTGSRAGAPSPGWWQGWGPLVVLPGAVVLLLPPGWPPWALMWLLAAAIFIGCKWLTWRRSAVRGVPPGRSLGYLLAWPGLDADSFLGGARSAPPPRPARSEWLLALVKLAVGLLVLFGLARQVPPGQPYLVGWTGMVGLVLVLHFGTFHLVSCAWRWTGVAARPLMDWPLASTSLASFWGRRWNTAFRDLTHRFLFRPLTRWLSPAGAIVAGFAFSGVIHDVVISVPADGGYGGPTLFFLLQGAGVLAERSRAGRTLGLGGGGRGWLFTVTLLLVPAPLLFHWPFVTRVMVPFLQALEAV